MSQLTIADLDFCQTAISAQRSIKGAKKLDLALDLAGDLSLQLDIGKNGNVYSRRSVAKGVAKAIAFDGTAKAKAYADAG